VSRKLIVLGNLKAHLDALRVGRTARTDVGRVVRQLVDAEELPGPSDVSALVSMTDSHLQAMLYGRRVPGRPLWVWYRSTDVQIELVGVTRARTPPSV
jgi:hypothetical protein